jgi:hypothetical protein
MSSIAGPQHLPTDERSERRAQGRENRISTIAFLVLTLLIVFEMAAGSLWDLLRIEYVRVVMTHLGYPLFLLSILGAWKLAGAVAVAVPGFPRLKEWAYAGFFFNYTGAWASHLLHGDGPDRWVGPFIFAAFTLGSWALRPAERRIPSTQVASETRPLAWAIPIGVVVLMLVFAYLTLPKGPPPGY